MSANAAPLDERVDRHLLRIAFMLVLGTFMATLDATIVSVGIDTLTDEFDVSVAEVQWVTTAYLLAVVAAVPASGWPADRFGGRWTWLAAVGVFLLGSVLCASAWSPHSSPAAMCRRYRHRTGRPRSTCAEPRCSHPAWPCWCSA
ncbi:MFS transporter [Streptomyces sp. NPDC091387]|uniref:MFS transporter n=1 Tax=Streptomyces sp. NPDC091387 TaxID=3365998 RepID=UPI0037FEF582